MRKLLFIIFLSMVFMVFMSSAFADTEVGPYPYKKYVCNNKYVLIMNPNKSFDFPSSGLYTNDAYMQKIWDADWYVHEGGVFITDDGIYAAILGPWARLDMDKKTNFNQLAVAFYKNGKLFKEYNIKDLIKNDNEVEKSASHFQWRKRLEYNEIDKILTISTISNKTYEFNLITGNMRRVFSSYLGSVLYYIFQYYFAFIVFIILAGRIIWLKYKRL